VSTGKIIVQSKIRLPGGVYGWRCPPAPNIVIGIVPEQGAHRLGACHLADGGWIPPHHLHGIAHCEFGVRLDDLWLSALNWDGKK